MKTSISKEVKSIIYSVVFLLIGLLSLWVCKTVLNIEINTVISLIIFFPVITYLLFSGTLKSFKYGNLEATLSDTVTKYMDSSDNATIESSVEQMFMIEKMGIDDIKRQLPQLEESQFIILTITLGKEKNHSVQVIKKYLETLSTFSTFKFIVFIDTSKRFVGYMSLNRAIGLLNNPNFDNTFVNLINQADYNMLHTIGLSTDTISTQTKTIDALKEMYNKNLDSMVVIDNAKNLAGIVERDYLVGKLLLSIVDK